ncbi:MAG: prolyl-tRNA synthetase associated domain-containing protein [Solobacterium sp.]|nr:prolyl-tRNA synthetase associated domain-containing protein [Solobacterium sp.]
MNREETLTVLKQNGIAFELFEHPAIFNMEEAAEIDLPWPEDEAKNLFVRDDKKRNYYLITVKGDKRVDLKQFRKEHGTRALSFASAEDLPAKLKLDPGSVTPLGLLNDESGSVILYLDEAFLEGTAMIGVHPNDNTATVHLKTDDLIRLLEKHGTQVNLIPISQ